MTQFSTIEILNQLNTRDEESCKKALKLLGDHFYEMWCQKAHFMIRKKVSDVRLKEEFETMDITNEAYRLFSEYVLKHPEQNAPHNRTHLEAMIANNIRFAISKMLRNRPPQSSLSPNPEDENQDPSELIEDKHSLMREYWLTMNNLFSAISKLSKEEYRDGSGLDPLVLCERKLFLDESIVDIAAKYGFSRKTIAKYWGDIQDFLRDETEQDCWFEDFGTRPAFQNIPQGAFLENRGLRDGDIVVSCNRMVFFNATSLSLHVAHMIERIQENEKDYHGELVILHTDGETKKYCFSWDEWKELWREISELKPRILGTVEFNAQI